MNSLDNYKIPNLNLAMLTLCSVFDPKQIAEAFNSYFNSTFLSSEFKLPQVSQLPTPSHQLSKIQIDRDDVLEALTGLDASKASGCDDIHPINYFEETCRNAIPNQSTFCFAN